MSKAELLEKFRQAGKPKAKKPVLLDRSLLEAYANCPYQGHCLLGGDKDEAGEPAQIGIEGHRIAERCLKEAFTNRYSGDELQTFADDVVQEIAQSRPDIQPKLIRAAKYLAEQIAHVPIERILVDAKGIPFIEYQIDYEFCETRDGRPVKITTCIDLAYSFRPEAIHVIDWKFGWLRYTNQMTADAFQVCHICYILFQLFPDVQTIHFWYVNPRYGTKGYACIRRSDEIPSMPHLTVEAMLLSRIDSAVQLYLAGSKEAWPEQKKCLYCPVIHKCPHKSKALEGIPTDTRELVDQIVVLQTLLKRHEDIATALWKKDGALQGTKHIWEYKPSRIKPRLLEFEPEEPENCEEQ